METERILVMDDEERVRKVTAEMLKHLGYRAKTVRNGEEAVAAYKQALAAGEPFAAVIADLMIPEGMGGQETVRSLLEIDPQAKVIVSSGFANNSILSKYSRYGFRGALPKPYLLETLSNTLQQVCGSRKEGS